jgi:hypothetical protein
MRQSVEWSDALVVVGVVLIVLAVVMSWLSR